MNAVLPPCSCGGRVIVEAGGAVCTSCGLQRPFMQIAPQKYCPHRARENYRHTYSRARRLATLLRALRGGRAKYPASLYAAAEKCKVPTAEAMREALKAHKASRKNYEAAPYLLRARFGVKLPSLPDEQIKTMVRIFTSIEKVMRLKGFKSRFPFCYLIRAIFVALSDLRFFPWLKRLRCKHVQRRHDAVWDKLVPHLRAAPELKRLKFLTSDALKLKTVNLVWA